jgi:4-hydroxythreonine-4-phosphate dehydrogenase
LKPLLISSGEPAGIGPDLCLALAAYKLPIVILADKTLLMARAKQLGLRVHLQDYQGAVGPIAENQLSVLEIPCAHPVMPGNLDTKNAAYVINMLSQGIDRCLQQEFSGFVTAPVHKGVLNEAGYAFTGHTEFLAERCNVETVVMMLACEKMKVALATTHVPLKKVSEQLSETLLIDVVTCLSTALQENFAINDPQIYVAGLNPHAGESGYLGREEIEIITPALQILKNRGISVHGPLPADTMFNQFEQVSDAFLAMYHDQGLPVLKYAGFGKAANITLGLPIIRTSVDHGTALELAGSGKAELGSMLTAIEMAITMANRKTTCQSSV